MTAVHLPECQTKILGHLSCFLWSCQIFGWTLKSDLRVQTSNGTILHLLFTPLEQWQDIAEQDWWSYAMARSKLKDEWKNLHISILDWRAMSAVCKQLPPLALKFRTFGILSGTAAAQMKGKMETKCELCRGQRHMVLDCPSTQKLRDKPQYCRLATVPTFTRCTGIPVRVTPWQPLPKNHVSNFSHGRQFSHIFTDGSASPPQYPSVRLSSWSVVGCHSQGDRYHLIASGLTPGYVHNICRAETFAALMAVEQITACTLYIDNQGVVNNLRKIMNNGCDPLVWRSHPNVDLWTNISNILVARGPNAFQVVKVESHQDASEAITSLGAWTIRGNDKADELVKNQLR